MTETRIRWHHVDGTVVEWFGYVGTVTETALFQILHPVAKPTEAVMGSRFDEWALCTTFPGESAKARYAGDRDGTKAVTELKAEAERWLAQFVTSLGAVFPDEAYEFPCCEHDLETAYAPGAYVRYQNPDAGWPDDQDKARELLTLGGLYRVAWNDIGQSKTSIGLVGVPGARFNSVLFEPVADEDVTDEEAAEVARRTAHAAATAADTEE